MIPGRFLRSLLTAPLPVGSPEDILSLWPVKMYASVREGAIPQRPHVSRMRGKQRPLSAVCVLAAPSSHPAGHALLLKFSPNLYRYIPSAEGRPATGNRGPSELPADIFFRAPCPLRRLRIYCVSGSAGGDNQRRISSRADVPPTFPPLPVHRAGIFLTCSSKRQAQG